MRVYPKIVSNAFAVAGSDALCVCLRIPGESTIHNVYIGQKVIGERMSVQQACLYGVDMYVVPMLDPDAVPVPEDMWDQQIPKDDAVGSDVLDMDTGDVDTSPVFEPGLPSIAALTGMTTTPTRMLKRRRLLTFGDRAAGFVAGTPDEFIPAETWRTQVKRDVYVPVPSMLMMAISSPDTLATESTWDVGGGEKGEGGWAMLKYLGDTLRMAMYELVGLTEVAALPFDEAAVCIANWMERLFEQQAAGFEPMMFIAFTECSVDMSVVGEVKVSGLSVA